MDREALRRFSVLMAAFGCPLYDPQLGVRFARLTVFLRDEAAQHQALIQRELSRLLPRLALELRAVGWDEYVRLSKALPTIQYSAAIHRGRTQTKVSSFLEFGAAWANRPCQCKTDQAEREPGLVAELLQTSIVRVVADFFERTYYG